MSRYTRYSVSSLKYMRILICWLPWSWKTTLARELASMLDFPIFNADEIRDMCNDWDFSPEARTRQAIRMDRLAGMVNDCIADFVCPTNETRIIFNADYTIFMDTITEWRYEDTNKIFERPEADIVVTEKDSKKWASIIRDKILWTERTQLFIGRYQPLHEWHCALFQTILDEWGKVCVGLRNTPINENNPYTIQERKKMLREKFWNSISIVTLPDIENVCYGRDVGWWVREIRLSEDIEKISATSLRKCL